MKKLFSIICAVALILGAMPAGVFAGECAITFNEAYAAAGVPLTVSVSGNSAGDVVHWFVNDTYVYTGNSYTPGEDQLCSFISARLISSSGETVAKAETYFSPLPVIYINTDDGEAISDKVNYKDASLLIQPGGDFVSDSPLYEGKTQIRGRGNTTWGFAKKPYKLKLSSSTNLFGMGKSKHWVLLANYIDESLMRNSLAAGLSETLGLCTMQTTWVDVVFNGTPAGCYQFSEQIRVADDRVDIYNWEDAAADAAKAVYSVEKENGMTKDERDDLEEVMCENLSWIDDGVISHNGREYIISYYYDIPDDLSGGYIIEMSDEFDEVSKFRTQRGAPMMINTPEFSSTSENMTEWLTEYIQAVEDALYSTDHCVDYNGEKLSYTQLIDFDELLAYWFIGESFVNEFGGKSTFMYKDSGGDVLHFGPHCDFDSSAGSDTPWGKRGYTEWVSTYNGRLWFSGLTDDVYFALKMREYYLENRYLIEDMIKDGGLIDTYYETLCRSGTKNSEIWFYKNGFESDKNALKEWLTGRLAWMDSQMVSDGTFLYSLGLGTLHTINLTPQNASGANLEVSADDSTVKLLPQGQALVVKAQKSSRLIRSYDYYVNGVYAGSCDFSEAETFYLPIENELLSAVDGKINVLQFWARGENGEYYGTNYVKLQAVACTHEWSFDKTTAEPTYKNEGQAEYVCLLCSERQTRAVERLECPAGDTNYDGKINSSDMLLLRLFIAGDSSVSSIINSEKADINSDSRINSTDILIIRIMIASISGDV